MKLTKKLIITTLLTALAVVLAASNAISYKVYLPLVIKGWERKDVYCNVSLYDSWGISPGYVKARATVEYHDQHDAVRLVPVRYPDTGTTAIFRWETHLLRPNLNPGFMINDVWGYNNPQPDTEWHGTGVPITVGRAWEAVTHLGGSKGYTIYVYIFPKGTTSYYNDILCTKIDHNP